MATQSEITVQRRPPSSSAPAADNGLLGEKSASVPRKRSRRNEYVSQACLNCRRRKVKCAGGPSCEECHKAGEICAYTETRRKKRTEPSRRSDTQRQLPSPAPPSQAAPRQQTEASEELPESVRAMMSRLSNLEQDYTSLRSTVATSEPQPPSHPMQRSPQSQTTPRSIISQHRNPAQNEHVSEYDVRAESSLLQPVAALHHSAHPGSFRQPASGSANMVPHDSSINALEADADIIQAERDVRVNNGARFRSSFATAFLLNSCHPLLNEHQFRARFDDFVFDTSSHQKSVEKYQFLALVHFVYAETELQSGHCTNSDVVLGWREFGIADKILREVGLLMKGNLLTIKCLLIKARYLLCAEKFDSAYETTSHAVRLCFQNNLHNQPVWSADVDGFSLTMRQRIFWATFTLERLVASTCGLPFLIRESDVRVDFPRLYDDQGLFPSRPLPAETPVCSYIPYQVASIKWARTYSEIWDRMFGVNAEKPVPQNQIDSIDVKLFQDLAELPIDLQWAPTVSDAALRAPLPHFKRRQQLICLMRINHLRLLVRQPSMMSLGFQKRTADDCLTIAASSIDACHSYFHASHYDIDRYFMNHYLTGAIIPLACIILRRDNDETSRPQATTLFHKAMAILESISVGYLLAQRMLQRFQSILNIANRPTEPHANGLQDGRLPDASNFQNAYGLSNVEESNHLMSQFLISNINTPLAGFQWDGVEAGFGGNDFGQTLMYAG